MLGQEIFRGDSQRRFFLTLLEETCELFDWTCLAYCLMGNHFHVLVEPHERTLSAGMRHLGSRYALAFNEWHGGQGAVFQGRFWSRPVDDDGYLVAVLRYIALNPVRAFLSQTPEGYAWSSHAACAGMGSPDLADTRRVHELLGCGPAGYRELVESAEPDALSELAIRVATEFDAEQRDLEIGRYHDLLGYQVCELAAALGCSERTINRRIARAADLAPMS